MSEDRRNRRWNVIAGTSVVLSLGWVGYCFFSGAPFSEIAAAVGPIIGVWTGLLVKLVE